MIPTTDPTPIVELFRGNYATELLTAAVSHFDVFGKLATRPMTLDELGPVLSLAPRPTIVLVTALRAMELLEADASGRLGLTAVAREHLVPGEPFYFGDYIGLRADAPGTLGMVERLHTNRPAGYRPEETSAFIYKKGDQDSAMEQEASARRLTLGLAGRARNVAPVLAARLPLPNARRLLDAGGGTGIYAVELLKANAHLRAAVWDRPEVLKVAREAAAGSGVEDRLELIPGDMFADPIPPGGFDAVLLSNVLHDWDVPECRALVRKCADAISPGGSIIVHDVFLNDALDGPLPVALYSAALFSVTEGRAYSAAEYGTFLREAGLTPESVIPTLVHCGALCGRK